MEDRRAWQNDQIYASEYLHFKKSSWCGGAHLESPHVGSRGRRIRNRRPALVTALMGTLSYPRASLQNTEAISNASIKGGGTQL